MLSLTVRHQTPLASGGSCNQQPLFLALVLAASTRWIEALRDEPHAKRCKRLLYDRAFRAHEHVVPRMTHLNERAARADGVRGNGEFVALEHIVVHRREHEKGLARNCDAGA